MPSAADDDEVGGRLEEGPVDVGRTADHQRGGAGQHAGEPFGGETDAHVDVEPRGSHDVEATRRELLGDEHAGGHGA